MQRNYVVIFSWFNNVFLLCFFFLHGNKYSPQQLTYAVARGNQIMYAIAKVSCSEGEIHRVWNYIKYSEGKINQAICVHAVKESQYHGLSTIRYSQIYMKSVQPLEKLYMIICCLGCFEHWHIISETEDRLVKEANFEDYQSSILETFRG